MTHFLQIVRRSVSQTCPVWVPTFLLRTGDSYISAFFERLRLLAFRGNCEDEEDWYGAGKNADFITDLIWRLVRVSLFSVLMRAGKPLK